MNSSKIVSNSYEQTYYDIYTELNEHDQSQRLWTFLMLLWAAAAKHWIPNHNLHWG